MPGRGAVLVVAFVLALLLVSAGMVPTVHAARVEPAMLEGAHGDTDLMPKSCRACHRGMNMRISGEEKTCLACHGSSGNRQEMVAAGYLAADLPGMADIGAQLRKPYSHPVFATGGVHYQLEALPEEVLDAPRHAECVDCHNPHRVDASDPFRGLAGRRVGNFIADIETEYQLCYRCHSTSANLPVTASDKQAEFRTTNASFHPVEGEGRNGYVISLKSPYVAKEEEAGDISVISCSDCHGSDGYGAPRGPHGSNFKGLLVLNYEMGDGRAESEFAYALCYKCHERASILGNESFPYHALHIEGNQASGSGGTSCYTCHDAHGSVRNQYLIRFNEDEVRPNADGKLEFEAEGVAARHGSCLLNCHGVEHNPLSY